LFVGLETGAAAWKHPIAPRQTVPWECGHEWPVGRMPPRSSPEVRKPLTLLILSNQLKISQQSNKTRNY